MNSIQSKDHRIGTNSEHKKECVKKNVATISHNQFKNVLLNNKRVRHLVNSIQSKDHRVGTY